MLPTAGLFLPQTLHRNIPSTSEEDTRRAKHKAMSRKSFDRPSTASTARSSVDDVGNVFASLTTVFKFADFVASLNEVSAEVEVFISLIRRVWQDVSEASRLMTCDAVTEYYAPFPERKAYLDNTVLDVRRALNEIGAYVESVRVGGLESGTVRMKQRFEWVLSHHQKLLSRELALVTCHRSLTTAIATMQVVEMGRESLPQVFEAPAQPWIKTTEREIMRSPHSRHKWRMTQRNLSLPSITVSEVEEEYIETRAINTIPSELPGSNPLDLAEPENWDLYEPPVKPPPSPPLPPEAPPETSTSTPRPPTTHSHSFPLATVDERPAGSDDEPNAFAKQRSIKLARRYRPRAVEVRKSIGKHQSLPSLSSELPYLPRHSSLISELSNWVLPNADSENYAGDVESRVTRKPAETRPDRDSSSSSATSPATPSSTVSCPEALRIRRPVSTIHSTPPTADTIQDTAPQKHAEGKIVTDATIKQTNVDDFVPTSTPAVETPNVEKPASRLSRYYANIDSTIDEPGEASEPQPSSSDQITSDSGSQKQSQADRTTIVAKFKATTTTTSPTSESSTSPDSPRFSSSHASQSSQSSISSQKSTTSSKMKYSLFPAPTVNDTAPQDTQPPIATMAMTAGTQVNTQPEISPETALSSHPPPSREDLPAASHSVEQTSEAPQVAPPIVEPVLSPPSVPGKEGEIVSPTDHNHYVSVCYSPKEKRKPSPPPSSTETRSPPPFPAPDRPLPSVPGDVEQTVIQRTSVPVIMLHSPKFPAHKQPWLPLEHTAQAEAKDVLVAELADGDTEVRAIPGTSETALPAPTPRASENSADTVPSADEHAVPPSSHKPESTNGSRTSTPAGAVTLPEMAAPNDPESSKTYTSAPKDVPHSPEEPVNPPFALAQVPQLPMIVTTETVKPEVQQTSKSPVAPEAESPKPMSAQAKRRRAQARRLQLAYGSD